MILFSIWFKVGLVILGILMGIWMLTWIPNSLLRQKGKDTIDDSFLIAMIISCAMIIIVMKALSLI